VTAAWSSSTKTAAVVGSKTGVCRTGQAAQRRPGWSQGKLARAAGVGLATLQRIEQSEGVVKGNFATVLKIKTLQNKAGIHFTDDEAGEIGVCLSAT
jgi:hypothetical protein